MSRRLEAHMIEPIRQLMREDMGLEVIVEEFSAGYGIADLVGASMSKENCRTRKSMGLTTPLDNRHFVEVLLLLRPGVRRSFTYLLNRIPLSESTLRQKVLPQMEAHGLIKRDADDYVSLLGEPSQPTECIVAVEAKQTRWRDAIIQARRYTFFADQTYIAVWNGAAGRVDRMLLYRHRIGLIGVEPDGAEVFFEAPTRKPRDPKMNRYCAEFLYRKALCLEDAEFYA